MNESAVKLMLGASSCRRAGTCERNCRHAAEAGPMMSSDTMAIAGHLAADSALLTPITPQSAGARMGRVSEPPNPKELFLMYRFFSWMAIGIAAAFLVVATAAFS